MSLAPPPQAQEPTDFNGHVAALVPKAPSVPRPPGQPRQPPVSLPFVGNPLDPANSDAAAFIQRRWRDRQKDISAKVPEKQKQDEELELAATKIQATFRGRKVREQVSTLTQDAAVAGLRGIQKVQSERRMQKEKSEVGKQPQQMLDTVMHALGSDDPESYEEIMHLEKSAVKIQAHHRRRAAQAEVDELRAKQRAVLERRARGEVTTPLQNEEKPQRGHKKPEYDDADPELEQAAAKIQSVHRGRQQRRKDAERKHKQRESNAAVKIQATHRGNQQRREAGHEAKARRLKSEETKAATKIQAIHRGNQQRKGSRKG